MRMKYVSVNNDNAKRNPQEISIRFKILPECEPTPKNMYESTINLVIKSNF